MAEARPEVGAVHHALEDVERRIEYLKTVRARATVELGWCQKERDRLRRHLGMFVVGEHDPKEQAS